MTLEERAQVRRAILAIHHHANYFQGMEILCEIAGWAGLVCVNEYDSEKDKELTRQSFDNWVKGKRAI